MVVTAISLAVHCGRVSHIVSLRRVAFSSWDHGSARMLGSSGSSYCNLIEWNGSPVALARAVLRRQEGRKKIWEDERRAKEQGQERKRAMREEGEPRGRSCGWTIQVLGSRRWYGGMVQRLPAASVVGGRAVARWEKRRTRRGGTENARWGYRWTIGEMDGREGWMGGQAWWQQSPWVGDTRFSWVISLMRHSDLPSPPSFSLFPSLPLCPVPLFLSLALFRNLLVSRRCNPRNGSLSTELYTYTRASLYVRADGLLEKSRANASGFANHSLSRDTDPHFLHAFDTVDTG